MACLSRRRHCIDQWIRKSLFETCAHKRGIKCESSSLIFGWGARPGRKRFPNWLQPLDFKFLRSHRTQAGSPFNLIGPFIQPTGIAQTNRPNSMFPSNSLIIRVPFFLVFSFNKETPRKNIKKRKTCTTGVPRFFLSNARAGEVRLPILQVNRRIILYAAFEPALLRASGAHS